MKYLIALILMLSFSVQSEDFISKVEITCHSYKNGSYKLFDNGFVEVSGEEKNYTQPVKVVMTKMTAWMMSGDKFFKMTNAKDVDLDMGKGTFSLDDGELLVDTRNQEGGWTLINKSKNTALMGLNCSVDFITVK